MAHQSLVYQRGGLVDLLCIQNEPTLDWETPRNFKQIDSNQLKTSMKKSACVVFTLTQKENSFNIQPVGRLAPEAQLSQQHRPNERAAR